MIAKCGTVIIGYGGMGGWHTQQLKTMEEINLLGVYDILPGRNLLAEEKGLRDQVKIMIGGAPITQSFCDSIGADCYTADAASCADEAIKFLAG